MVFVERLVKRSVNSYIAFCYVIINRCGIPGRDVRIKSDFTAI